MQLSGSAADPITSAPKRVAQSSHSCAEIGMDSIPTCRVRNHRLSVGPLPAAGWAGGPRLRGWGSRSRAGRRDRTSRTTWCGPRRAPMVTSSLALVRIPHLAAPVQSSPHCVAPWPLHCCNTTSHQAVQTPLTLRTSSSLAIADLLDKSAGPPAKPIYGSPPLVRLYPSLDGGLHEYIRPPSGTATVPGHDGFRAPRSS